MINIYNIYNIYMWNHVEIYGVASKNVKKPTSTVPCDVPQLQSQGAVGSGGGMMSQRRKGDVLRWISTWMSFFC